MEGGDLPADGQPQPHGLQAGLAGFGFKRRHQLPLLHPAAVVLHRHQDLAAVPAQLQADLAALSLQAVQRVGDQVVNQGAQQLLFPLNQHAALVLLVAQLGADRFHQQVSLPVELAAQPCQVKDLGRIPLLCAAVLQLAQGLHIPGQAEHPVVALLKQRQIALVAQPLGLYQAAFQHLDRGGHGGHGSPHPLGQLVEPDPGAGIFPLLLVQQVFLLMQLKQEMQ